MQLSARIQPITNTALTQPSLFCDGLYLHCPCNHERCILSRSFPMPSDTAHITSICAAVNIDQDSFRRAVAVVIAHAAYLPSVQCFALLPIASTLQRTGADTGAALDYDIDNGCVSLTAQRTIRYAKLAVPGVHIGQSINQSVTFLSWGPIRGFNRQHFWECR